MNLDLTGKTAFVGGGSKGIGKAIALKLAELGANVILTARGEDILKSTIKELDTSKGQSHSYAVLDFSDRESVRTTINNICKRITVHILVNNTGGPAAGWLSQATEEQFLDALNNHLLCNHILAQSVLTGMKIVGYGRIINIISTSVKEPIEKLGVSNTTRGAVASWAKTLSNEVAADGITVNNVLPGFTETERLAYIIENSAKAQGISEEAVVENMKKTVPAARFAKPEEIANVAAFLASPAAAYVNGVSIAVDGGRMRSI